MLDRATFRQPKSHILNSEISREDLEQHLWAQKALVPIKSCLDECPEESPGLLERTRQFVADLVRDSGYLGQVKSPSLEPDWIHHTAAPSVTSIGRGSSSSASWGRYNREGYSIKL